MVDSSCTIGQPERVSFAVDVACAECGRPIAEPFVEPAPPRHLARILLLPLLAVAISLGSITMYASFASDEAIARQRGELTWFNDGTPAQICIKDTTDAGSTFGNFGSQHLLCWSGNFEGDGASIGDCVILQIAAEPEYLRVEQADGC